MTASTLALLLWLTATGRVSEVWAAKNDQNPPANLKQLSLEQLGNLEVTTVSKEPEEIQKTAAAIYVLTQEDIRRSGATSIPEALRLVPGVEVAQIDSSTWAVGIRGFGSIFLEIGTRAHRWTKRLHAAFCRRKLETAERDAGGCGTHRGHPRSGRNHLGTNAVNGVINIITKNSKDTRGTLASVGGGNVDRGTGEFRQGGGFGRNASYRVYGMAFGRGPELPYRWQ